MIKFLLKRLGCSEKAIRFWGYFQEFVYWALVIYLILTSNNYLYKYCGLKIAEIEQECVVTCFNYTPTEHNWSNIIYGSGSI